MLFLLFEGLNPKNRQIKASLQARRYFNPGNQAALRRVLFDWARVHRSTVARLEQHEDDVMKHQ